jgi:hypothetical protein
MMAPEKIHGQACRRPRRRMRGRSATCSDRTAGTTRSSATGTALRGVIRVPRTYATRLNCEPSKRSRRVTHGRSGRSVRSTITNGSPRTTGTAPCGRRRQRPGCSARCRTSPRPGRTMSGWSASRTTLTATTRGRCTGTGQAGRLCRILSGSTDGRGSTPSMPRVLMTSGRWVPASPTRSRSIGTASDGPRDPFPARSDSARHSSVSSRSPRPTHGLWARTTTGRHAARTMERHELGAPDTGRCFRVVQRLQGVRRISLRRLGRRE